MSAPSRTGVGDHVEVALVGAGPQALAAALHLIDAGVSPADVLAVDPTGRWLARWDHQLGRHEIEHLRSPGVHHPGPRPYELSDRARSLEGPEALLVGRYGLPGAEAFASYCRLLVERADLGGRVLAARAHEVTAAGDGATVRLDDGTTVSAERVVVALNGAQPVLPPWAAAIDGARHSDDVDLRRLDDLDGQEVVVVGGGLTAVQLVLGVARRGGHPTLVTRRRLQVQSFDADPGWLGPKLLHAFWAEPDPAVRRRRLAEVRKGSVPEADAHRLDALVHQRRADLVTGCQVEGGEATADGRLVLLLDDGARLEADHVWCATGHRHDVLAQPELAPLVHEHPVPTCDGLPVLDDDLSWGGLPVHLMGAYAGLVLGPTSRNLSGARRAAERIAEAHRPGHLLRRPAGLGTPR